MLPTHPTVDDVLTTSRAARELGLAENTIRHLADSGVLPCKRAGRLRLFVRGDVLRLRELRAAGVAR
jgi:excisionase family DNA binding protein